MGTDLNVVGRCRVCGCSNDRPCELEDGMPCAWVDLEKTLCCNPRCVALVPLADLEQLHIPPPLNA